MAKNLPFEKCTATSKNKIVVAEERSKQLRIINPYKKPISKIQIDGCLITDDSLKCDYVFEIDIPVSNAIYLELKGTDIPHAVKQLKSTLQLFKEKHKELKKDCIVVCYSVPRTTLIIQKYKLELKRSFNANLQIRENVFSVTI